MTKENKIFNFNSNWNSKFLFAAYRSEKKQLKWILKHKLYNVRWDDNLFEKRDGVVKSILLQTISCYMIAEIILRDVVCLSGMAIEQQ